MKIKNKNTIGSINESTDISSFEDVYVLDSLVEVEKDDISTFLEDITDFEITTSPNTVVVNLLSRYNVDNQISYDNSVVITVNDASSLDVGNIYTFGTIPVEVLYKENNNVLVKIDVANRMAIITAPASTLISGTVIIVGVSVNSTSVRGLFSKYTGKYTKSEMEYLANAKSIDFTLTANALELGSNKIKTSFTREVLQDIEAYLGKDDLIKNELKSIIIREIEIDALETMRKMSTKYSLLDLSASYGIDDGLFSVSQDLYSAVKVMTNDVIASTQHKQDMFITVSKNVANLMTASPLFMISNEKVPTKLRKGVVKAGKLGMYDVFIDYYTLGDYIMVGTSSTGTDAGLSVRLYDKIMFAEIPDPETGNPVIWAFLRNGSAKNPNDVPYDDKSLYFASCEVDTTGLTNFPITKL